MSDYINTLFLRFRDLVTETNETISKHKAIIDEKGYVWWAWWKKGHETTPLSEFGVLSARAKENTISVYLVDSGQDKLYIATCNDISYSENTPKLSPEQEYTPEYYKNNAYFAWFKFTSIQECPNNEVRKYSYLKTKSLFKDRETNYDIFDNKIVFNTAELIQQNRTIWFVRGFEDGDKENEIVLLDADVVQPYVFSDKYNEIHGNTFLWLSDLHFSNGELDVKNTPNKMSLTNHIKKCCDADVFDDISTLIISGDLTDCCTPEGFELTKDFISDFNRESHFKLDSDNIIICPGNHDLSRINDESPAEPKYFYETEATGEHYCDIFKDIYHIKPNKFFSVGRKFLTKSGKTVEVVALNSIMLQQYKNFEGHGYISQEQLDCVADSMDWDNNDGSSSYRIVVMHHHYCPACLSEKIDVFKSSSVVYDADRLMKWMVKNNVKMLLHGHKHNSFISKVLHPKLMSNFTMDDMHNITTLSFGGTGAKGTEHKFATLSFETDNIVYRTYKIYPDGSSESSMEQKILIPWE